MNIRLASGGNDEWAVYSDKGFNQFKTIELASTYLTATFSIDDDEIDEALMHMAADNKPVAVFDENEGLFMHTTTL